MFILALIRLPIEDNAQCSKNGKIVQRSIGMSLEAFDGTAPVEKNPQNFHFCL